MGADSKAFFPGRQGAPPPSDQVGRCRVRVQPPPLHPDLLQLPEVQPPPRALRQHGQDHQGHEGQTK